MRARCTEGKLYDVRPYRALLYEIMTPTPRFAFINPPFRDGTIFMKEIGRCGRRSIGGELWPQTGLGYLAAVARQAGADVRLFDAMALGWDFDETLARLAEFDPELLVLLSTTPTFNSDRQFMDVLHERLDTVSILAVGTHVTALPKETLEGSAADAVLLGEGERFIERIARDWPGRLEPADGLAIKWNGSIDIRPERETVDDLDTLPTPARDLLPTRRYTMPFTEGRPFATVVPNRGCPYPCTFCRAGDVWGKKVRTRSPERIVEELTELRDVWGIRDITFMTDTLLTRDAWAESLFDAMNDADLDLRWIGNARVDEVRSGTLEKMKKSGCQLLSFGIESGNQSILDATRKGITLQQSLDGIRKVRAAGITAFAYFILGLPGETQETIEETIAFAKELEADYVNFHIATPFPGTEFYDRAVANGWLISADWEDFEEEGSAVISYPHLSADELVAAQKRAMWSLYTAPSRLFRELRRIRSPRDFLAKAKAGARVLLRSRA